MPNVRRGPPAIGSGKSSLAALARNPIIPHLDRSPSLIAPFVMAGVDLARTSALSAARPQ